MVEKVRKHVLIQGEVQGVGFRWFAQKNASRQNLSGWIRNLSDGRVELEVEGDQKAVETFLDTLRHHHPLARIHQMDIQDRRLTGRNTSFDIQG